MNTDVYNCIRSGGSGFTELPRGLFAVWGKESVQFLDGLITNDVKTLEDGAEMLAAFPNAQGRLLALVRVLRQGKRFLIETEEATREKLFQNLFRFTYAGDFFVEDLSEQYQYFETYGRESATVALDGGFVFNAGRSNGCFVPAAASDEFRRSLIENEAAEISDELYETLRIEAGVPKFGVDMDENTIVPELGFDEMISYKKGCYIGQEIIARIHFRGHVAKQLTGIQSEPGAIATGFLDAGEEEFPAETQRRGGELESEPGAIATGFLPGRELTTFEGKNAGRITSVTYSPWLRKHIALGYVRYEHLNEGTELLFGESRVVVNRIPFV